MSNNLQTLRDNLGHLAGRDREFAESLLDQSAGRGLTAKQLPWIDRLIARATQPAPTVGDVSGVVALMTRPGKQSAKITLRCEPSGFAFRLSIAGQGSAHPGSIAITSTDRGFGNRLFYGRVLRDGTFLEGRDFVPEIIPNLQALANDPAGVAAAYGRLTGYCCFCATELTDPPSLAVGYGPVCAKRFGLPWSRAVTTRPVREG